MIALALALGCTQPGDELVERWNVVFRVDAMTEDEGCDPSVTPAAPEQPYIGIGFGRGYPDTASVYWCGSQTRCEPTPWATFWVDEVTATRLSGQRGEISLTGDRLCRISWSGGQARRKGSSIFFDTQLFSGSPIEVDSGAECEEVLEAVIGTTCTITRSFEGTLVP